MTVYLQSKPEKQIFDEVREMGIDIDVFSNTLTDLNTQNEITRSCLILDNLINFETIDNDSKDSNISKKTSNENAIVYLQNISKMVATFNNNSSTTNENLKTLCFILKNFPLLAKVHTFMANKMHFFALDFLGIFTFVSRQPVLSLSIYEVSTKLVSFLQIFKKKWVVNANDYASKEDEMFIKTLLKRFKLAISGNF